MCMFAHRRTWYQRDKGVLECAKLFDMRPVEHDLLSRAV